MMNVLYIKYDTGYMNIVMDAFFPCGTAKFKKLLKVIDLDWQHKEELIETLKNYFQNQIPLCQAAQKDFAKSYADAIQLRNDTQQKIESRKQPNGVPLTKNDIEHEKILLQQYKKEVANSLSEYKRKKKAVEQYKRLLEIIEQ